MASSKSVNDLSGVEFHDQVSITRRQEEVAPSLADEPTDLPPMVGPLRGCREVGTRLRLRVLREVVKGEA